LEVDWKDYIDITTITKLPGYDMLQRACPAYSGERDFFVQLHYSWSWLKLYLPSANPFLQNNFPGLISS